MKIELRQEIDSDFRTWYRVYSDNKQVYGNTMKHKAMEVFEMLGKNDGQTPLPIVLESKEISHSE